MREYHLAKEHMTTLQQTVKRERLLNNRDSKSVTINWSRRLRSLMSSDNLSVGSSVTVTDLTPHHNT